MEKEIIERQFYQSKLDHNIRLYFYPHGSENKTSISHAICVSTPDIEPGEHRKPEDDRKIFHVWGLTNGDGSKNDHISCIQAEREYPLNDLVSREIIEKSLELFGINATQLSIVEDEKNVVRAGHDKPVDYSLHSSRLERVIKSLALVS